MSSFIFFAVLLTVYLVPTPSSTQKPYHDEAYSEKYHADRVSHYFDIEETVNFIHSLILDMMESDYKIKLYSVLSSARSDQNNYEDAAAVYKGYEDTVKLLDDMPDSSVTIYEFLRTIELLFSQDFLTQELYHVEKMCDYTDNAGQNGNNKKHPSPIPYVYNPDRLIFEGLNIYDPDVWLQRLEHLDELYSMSALPMDFDDFIKKKTKQALEKEVRYCEREIPFNIKLLQLFQYLAKGERIRFILAAAAHQVKYACHQSNDTDVLYELGNSAIQRTQNYMMTVKQSMELAPREIRLCDLEEEDNSKYIAADRLSRMSLKEAVSDLGRNEIITAIAFGFKNDIIYPRLQTSILSSNGYVRTKRDSSKFDWEKFSDDTPYSWSDVDYIDFGNEPSQIQKINLDDIYLDDDHVVTGVKFSVISNDSERNIAGSAAGVTIGLQVRATKFDFATGRLGESKWIHGKTPMARRTELKLGDLYKPFEMNKNFPDSVDGQYVQFRNIYSADGRKITVPLFDRHTRTILFTYPLGGVGLYHNGAPGSAGSISFKLISYNPAKYMRSDISYGVIDGKNDGPVVRVV